MSKNKSESDRETRSELRDLRADIKEMTNGVEFMEKEFEAMKKQLAKERNERLSLKQENEKLRAKCKENESKIEELHRRLVQCEQYSRRSNVEIKGFVEAENEDVTDLVSKLGAAIGEPISADDIEVCHRVPTRQEGKSNVVVQFKSRSKRDVVLEKARKNRIKNSSVGISNEGAEFVNDHLCPFLKKLLAQAIAKKREHQWRFVWTRNGRIYARKSEASDSVRIQSERDLEKIA
ncbi:hypothetical protein HPB48_016261 [Haemaphysalis longicornis]|uniref:FP protein C-terminal domain-containing protein n=1 Tax=Haemaphysalis longicornis TaxID=44386 RepID=A0A9J6G0P4_HAELO|nr:hypothetical protein HPB48_016261 [Haemaphysalis longicornis]